MKPITGLLRIRRKETSGFPKMKLRAFMVALKTEIYGLLFFFHRPTVYFDKITSALGLSSRFTFEKYFV